MSELISLALASGVFTPGSSAGACLASSSVPTTLPNPIEWAKSACTNVKVETVAEKKQLAAPKQAAKPLYLRICILSATELAAGDITGHSDPYVEVSFNQQSFATPVQSRTLNPVWEHLIECEVKEAGVVTLNVFDRALGRKGAYLGGSTLVVPKHPSKLRREVLQLRNVPSGWFKKPPSSRLTVLWHVVDRLEGQPDLVDLSQRVLEDPEGSQEPQTYNILVTILQSDHPKTHEGMLSAIRVSVGLKEEKHESTTPFGKPSGSSFIYGPKRGWRTQFVLPDATFEDLLQKRLKLEWLMRKGESSVIEDARLLEEAEQVDGDNFTLAHNNISRPSTEMLRPIEEGALEEKGIIVDVELEDDADDQGITAAEKLKLKRAKFKAEKRRQILQSRLKNAPIRRLTVHGIFLTPLDEIHDFCKEIGVQWAGWATLTFKGIFVGSVLLHVDIRSELDAYRRQIDLFRFPPPVIKGMETTNLDSEAAKKSQIVVKKSVQQLFCYAYADFLPKVDMTFCGLVKSHPWEGCDPFLNITVYGLPKGTKRFSTAVISNQQREVEWDPFSILVPTDKRRPRIVMELFDSDSPIASSQLANLCKTLLGEVRLNTIALQKPIWYHLFGGAVNAPRPDIDIAMMKGAIEPASTYHGSICLLFDKKRIKRRGWPPFPDITGVPMRLELRLYRGLYLPEAYRGKYITLLVQVPGCLLPMADSLGTLLEPEKALPLEQKPDFRTKRQMCEIPDANADILAFPGRVDENGVMRFFPWTQPKEELLAAFENAKKRWLKLGKARGEPEPQPLETEPNTAWVSRISCTLNILPQVEWCFVYIMEEGAESRLPAIFGKIPLRYPQNYTVNQLQSQRNKFSAAAWPSPEALKSSRKVRKRRFKGTNIHSTRFKHTNTPDADIGPDAIEHQKAEGRYPIFANPPQAAEWVQLHWDQSVTELPIAHYVSDFAGVLCGWARLELDPLTKAKVNGWKKLKKLLLQSTLQSGDENTLTTANEAIDKFIAEQKLPLLEPNPLVPTPQKVDYLWGLDSRVKRQGAPGVFVKFERLSPTCAANTGNTNFNDKKIICDPSLKPTTANTIDVYLHADLLQARKLPVLGQTGFTNPTWEIHIEDQVAEMIPEENIEPRLANIPVSTNPSFLQRCVAKFETYCPPPTALYSNRYRRLPEHDALEVPLPPVVVKLYHLEWESDASDSDTEEEGEGGVPAIEETQSELYANRFRSDQTELLVADNAILQPDSNHSQLSRRITSQRMKKQKRGTISKELIGQFIEWDVKDLDNHYLDSYTSRSTQQQFSGIMTETSNVLDVNARHTPIWYSLESNECITYDELERESPKAYSWMTKCRLMCCLGFSRQAPRLQELLLAMQRANGLQSGTGIQAPIKHSFSKKMSRGVVLGRQMLLHQVAKNRDESEVETMSSTTTTATSAFRRASGAAWTASDWSDEEGKPLKKRQQWPVINLTADHSLTGCDVRYYRFDLDLLGLRQLGKMLVDVPESDLKLNISSFWGCNNKQQLEFPIPVSEFSAPNMMPKLIGVEEPGTSLPAGITVLASKKYSTSPAQGRGQTTTVGLHVGTRIRSPVFATPKLDYLQEKLDFSDYPNEEDAALRSKTRVILPDVTARLSAMDGEVVGAMSLALQEFLRVPQGLRAFQLQLKCPNLVDIKSVAATNRLDVETTELKEKLALLNVSLVPQKDIIKEPTTEDMLKTYEKSGFNIKHIECQTECATAVFVDCFSNTTGDLTYDDDMVPGRSLLDHDLWHIQSNQIDENGDAVPPQTTLFNADDYFLGWEERQHACFMQPALRLGTLDYGGPSSIEYALMYELLFGKKDIVDTIESAMSNFWAGCKESLTGCCKVAEDTCVKPCRKKKRHSSEGTNIPAVEKREAHSLQESECTDSIVPAKAVSQTLEITLWRKEPDEVRFALATWLRPVGHVIRFDQKHWGSRIVARLQMMRRATRQEKRQHGFDHVGTFNMVNICCQKEGVVVWRTPKIHDKETGCLYTRCGETIMVVQGFKDKKFYRVVIPSFDLRYPSENSFFVLNTLTQCFLDIEEMWIEQAMIKLDNEVSQAQKKKQRETLEETRNDFKIQMRNLQSRELFSIGPDVDILEVFKLYEGQKDLQSRLGFESPLPTKKGEFVCRLMQTGYNFTHRSQSAYWFDVVELLPTMNIVQEVYAGQDQLQVCQLKGCLRIDHIPKSLAEELQAAATTTTITSLAPKYEEPEVMAAPLRHKWQVENVIVRVYVLTARNLENVDLIGKSDPYIKVECNGVVDQSETVFQDELDPDFYERFIIPVAIPGNAQLKITVMDKGDVITSDVPIGTVSVDLEERWLALRHRKLEKWEVESAIQHKRDLWLPPTPLLPIEIVPLFKGDLASGSSVSTGYLRFMIDMTPENGDTSEVPIDTLKIADKFDFTLTVWKVTDISIFLDPGERNNVMVEAVLRVTNIKLETTEQKWYTDVHEFANTCAYFSWRTTVQLPMPALCVDIKFSLIHCDPFTTNKPIYGPEKRSFDDFCRIQLGRYRKDDPLMGQMDHIVEFNEPMFQSGTATICRNMCCRPLENIGCTKNCTRAGCGPCFAPQSIADGEGTELDGVYAPDFCACCLREKDKRLRHMRKRYLVKPAKLHITVAVNPAGSVEFPPLPPPPHRPVKGMIFRDPVGYLKIILGPKACGLIQIGMGSGCALIILTLIITIIAIIVIAVKLK